MNGTKFSHTNGSISPTSHVQKLGMCVRAPQSLPGVHLMNTINHTSVVKYTAGGMTGSIVGSISRSDLHHRVLQLQHINIERQTQALLFLAQRSLIIKVQATNAPHVWEKSDQESQLHPSPRYLVASSHSHFVFIHENKWSSPASCTGQRRSSWLRRPSGFVTLFLHVVMAVQRERTGESGTGAEWQ